MFQPAEGFSVTPSVQLLHKLGAGGMGSVWVADHLTLHTQVVVKFMSSELLVDPTSVERFSREAAAAAQVKSPHVVQIFDHGVTKEGIPFIVMELLEGRDLGDLLESRGSIDARSLTTIVAQLAKALSRAHDRGIVHRDIKPENIFLCDTGDGELFTKLLDFGIAKSENQGLSQSTRTGALIGSPYYMSPEQLVGAKDVDLRSDIWSLGVVAFQSLTGQRPFLGENLGALAVKIHQEELPVPSSVAAGLPPAFDGWFARACARKREDRFGSAREAALALRTALLDSDAPRAALVSLPDAAPHVPTQAVSANNVPMRTTSPVSSSMEESTEQPPQKRAAGVWLAVGAVGLILIGGGVLALRSGGAAAAGPEPPSSAAASASAPLVVPAVASASASSAAAVREPSAPPSASAAASASAAPSALQVRPLHTKPPSPWPRPHPPPPTKPRPTTAPTPVKQTPKVPKLGERPI